MHMPQVRDDRLFSHLNKSMSQKALLLTWFTCLPGLIVIRERDWNWYWNFVISLILRGCLSNHSKMSPSLFYWGGICSRLQSNSRWAIGRVRFSNNLHCSSTCRTCEIQAFVTCLKRIFHKDHELLILQNILSSYSEENDACRMATITKYIVAAKVKVFE